MDGVFKFFPNGFGLFGVEAGDQDRLLAGVNFGGDFDNLFWSLAGAKNDFGKTFAQGAVCIHLGKAQISDGQAAWKAVLSVWGREYFIGPEIFAGV